MIAEKRLPHKRLTLLQLTERLRNISKACRCHGISRSQFYKYKRGFQEQGLDGLVDRLPISNSFPSETPREIKEKAIALSLDHPA
jgi:transposase-like protein